MPGKDGEKKAHGLGYIIRMNLVSIKMSIKIKKMFL
jgi:hypothetical protein